MSLQGWVIITLLSLQSQFGFGAPLTAAIGDLDPAAIVPVAVINANLGEDACEADLSQTRPSSLKRQALSFFRRQEWAEALVALIQLSAADPQPYYFRLIAETYLHIDQPARAAEAYKQALVNDRDNVRTWMALWKAETQAKNYPGAYNAARQVARREPGNVIGQTILAQSLAAIQRGPEGLAVLAKARHSFPGDDGVLRVMIRMQIQENAFEDALLSTRELLHLSPDDEYAQRMQALVLKILGRHRELRTAARGLQSPVLRCYYEATAALGLGQTDLALSLLSSTNLTPVAEGGALTQLVLWKLAEVNFAKGLYLRAYQNLVQIAQLASRVDLFVVAGFAAIQKKNLRLEFPPFLQLLRRQTSQSRLRDSLESGSPFLMAFSRGVSQGERTFRGGTSGIWELGEILRLLPVDGLAARVAK